MTFIQGLGNPPRLEQADYREFQMMHSFLANNRDELVGRCKAKVDKRPHGDATEQQLANGIPKFLELVTRTLSAEEAGRDQASLDISGGPIGDASARSRIGASASSHGANLLALGDTVDQVVHDCGELCQAITDLAFERDAPFSVHEIEVHDRCGGLPPSIAQGVFTPFSQRSNDNSGLGLGLAIARNSVESDLGPLTVRDVPETGCVFTISLPLHRLPTAV